MEVLTGMVNREQVYCPSSDRDTSLTLMLSSCHDARTSSILLSLRAEKQKEQSALRRDPAGEQSVGCYTRGSRKVPSETGPWNTGMWTQLSMQSSLFSLWNKVYEFSKFLSGVLGDL